MIKRSGSWKQRKTTSDPSKQLAVTRCSEGRRARGGGGGSARAAAGSALSGRHKAPAETRPLPIPREHSSSLADVLITPLHRSTAAACGKPGSPVPYEQFKMWPQPLLRPAAAAQTHPEPHQPPQSPANAQPRSSLTFSASEFCIIWIIHAEHSKRRHTGRNSQNYSWAFSNLNCDLSKRWVARPRGWLGEAPAQAAAGAIKGK